MLRIPTGIVTHYESNKPRYRLAGRLLLYGLVAFLLFRHFFPAQQVTVMSEKAAHTAAGVKLAASAAGFDLGTGHSKRIAQAVAQAAEAPPDDVVENVRGRDVMREAQKATTKFEGNFSILTDPARPTEKPVIDPNKTYRLENKIIKAYPDTLTEATVYFSTAGEVAGVDLARLKRVTVFKQTGYFGPTINYDKDRSSKLRIGVRLAVTD